MSEIPENIKAILRGEGVSAQCYKRLKDAWPVVPEQEIAAARKDLAAVKGHAGAEGQSCITCHDPHTGTDKFLLRGDAKKPAATQ